MTAQLTGLGYLLERSAKSLLAVDARDGALARTVANVLAEEERQTPMKYETGRTV